MTISQWSTTAATNASAATGINWAEGQLPSTVNDSARQLMADVRTWTDDGGWHNWGDTHTYSSATATTVSGNVTARYHAGRAVRAVGSSTGTIYGKVASSSYSAPNTTINYTWDSGSLSNETLTVSIGFTGVTGKPIDATGIRGLTSGNMVNTGTPAANQIPKYTDTSGTAIEPGYTVGTSANNIVQLTAAAKLPAVDGSLLTGLTTYPSYHVHEVTSNGTFTIPTGVTSLKVVVIGGGGGGGASSAANFGGSGGGGGGVVLKTLTGLTPGNTLTCTIGAAGAGGATNGANGSAGGNSTLTSGTQTISTLTAGGGSAGLGGTSRQLGGAGGSASGGDINVASNYGSMPDTGPPQGGAGGDTQRSMIGTASLITVAGPVGHATTSDTYGGISYGHGGPGGYVTGSFYAGGDGKAGAIIFEWTA